MSYSPTIKLKFISGLAIMLLPIMIIAFMAFYALRETSGSYNRLMKEVVEEIPRVSKIKNLMMMAQMPPNDYLISGNKAEQNTFGYFVQQIDDALFDLKQAPFSHKQEIQLAELAQENWQQAKILAGKIFVNGAPQGDPLVEENMEAFDAQVGKAVTILNQLERRSYHEISQEKTSAQTWAHSLNMVIGFCLVAGLAIASFTGLLLARMVLKPLRELTIHAETIGRGEFPETVVLRNNDEFSKVMDTFNIMAMNLKQNQSVLKDMAMRDGLTGLLNRREFRRILERELDRARRQRTKLSVIMLDIDFFKKINDNYGHLIGDNVLRSVASIMGQQIRTMDSIARYGGEEFVIITPETSEAALNIAERIRIAVAAQNFHDASGEVFRVTISCGVASYPNHAVEESELVNKADQALYQAKEQGRNRVCGACSPPKQHNNAKVINLEQPLQRN